MQAEICHTNNLSVIGIMQTMEICMTITTPEIKDIQW